MPVASETQTLWSLVKTGGVTLYPLLACSLLVWAVIFERLWVYRRLGHHLNSFHLKAMNTLLQGHKAALKELCQAESDLPTAQLVLVALERLGAKDSRIRAQWWEAVERRRQMQSLELKKFFWILGTISSSAPFIGLFGTVLGVLRSFQEMAGSSGGAGGFAVVAAGISEALVTTAAGIVVAIIAVIAFNAFQVQWTQLVLRVRLQMEEIAELLVLEGAVTEDESGHG